MRQPGGPAECRSPNGEPNRTIRRLRWASLLNSLFIALELAAGITVNSLALISDAWHNLTDVLGLGIAWFAVWQVRRPADSARTFGYHRAGILTAMSCHVVVEDQSLSSGGLLAERIRRELQDRFRIGHATIQLEAALPAPADPLPIHHEGGTVR
jgi:Co/Zn/Cd efflux system component